MTPSARVSAQAKVNLILRVLAREASGFHSIETVFLRLDLADDVSVRIAPGRALECRGPTLPSTGLGPVEQNLAYRAAVGAGLGGGSADAGAVLRALDALSPSPLGSRLIEIAAPLGADVPFMTIESPMALAWGRGERLFPLHALEPRPVVIVMPEFPVATADAYAWLASDRGSYVPTGDVLAPESVATWEAIAAVATNDFGPVVSRRRPEIGEIMDSLSSLNAIFSLLSGSGSSVFGVFDAAPNAAGVAPSRGSRTFVTSTSDRVVRVDAVR